MSEELTREDWEFINTALTYTENAFDAYQYPSYETRQAQLARVRAVREKVLDAKRRARLHWDPRVDDLIGVSADKTCAEILELIQTLRDRRAMAARRPTP